MDIPQIIINFFTLTIPRYSIMLLVTFGIISCLFFFIYKYKPKWRYLAYAILLVLIIRGILFGQYISWEFYEDRLLVDDIGWRQASVIYHEYYKFFSNTHKIKYLAVGSSQTRSVYLPYSKDNLDLIVFDLAAMGPLDYYLYRNYIVDRDPEYVLLYLSEFDLAKEPNLNASRLGPSQGLGILEIFPTLVRISKDTHSEMALKEMIAGEFFPEYRYSFIFKAFLNRKSKKNEALAIPTLFKELFPDAEHLKTYIDTMQSGLDKRWIGYNTYFLRKFLSYCSARSIKVIIVEGQYNPLAYTEKSGSLNRAVREELKSVVRDFSQVIFLPRTELIQFTSKDYNDVAHVKPDSGYRFAEHLIHRLNIK